MKKSKIIVPALAMLVMSTAATVTGTVAWFSMNKTVSASGMAVRAQAEGSIVITTGTLPKADTKATNVVFPGQTTNIYASTHDGEMSSGLKYVTNGDNVNVETGLVKNTESTSALNYANALGTGEKIHYVDYAVCIAASADEAFENQDLTITINANTFSGNVNKAISVDFYEAEVTSGSTTAVPVNTTTWKGTLNLAGLDASANDASTTKANIVLSDITIPKANNTKAIGILMRVFFDGALLEKKGTESTVATYYAVTSDEKAVEANTYGNKYYYDDIKGTNVVTTTVGETVVSGKYEVDTSKSSYAFARTTQVGVIANMTLNASFTTANHVG